jgi:hypothetical protein
MTEQRIKQRMPRRASMSHMTAAMQHVVARYANGHTLEASGSQANGNFYRYSTEVLQTIK